MRTVTLPDGTVVDGVPDNVTDQEVQRRMGVVDSAQTLGGGLAGIGRGNSVVDSAKQLGLGAVDATAGPIAASLGGNSVYNAIPAMGMFDRILRTTGKVLGTNQGGFKEAGQDLGELNTRIQQQNTPTTEAGRWSRAIGKELPYTALGFGGPFAKLLQSVSAGVGAEAGGRAFGPLGEMLGSFLGGTLPAAAQKSLPRNATRQMREAVQGLGPVDFMKAREKSRLLTDEGISHTSAQLFDTPTLPSLFTETAQHPRVAPKVFQKFRNVPQEVSGALTAKMDFELGNPGTTRDNLRTVQEATANALRDEMAAANANYGAAKSRALTGAAPANQDDVLAIADELANRSKKFAVGTPKRALYEKVRRTLYGEDIPITPQTKLDAEMRGLPGNPTFWPDNLVVDKDVLSNLNADLNAMISESGLKRTDPDVIQMRTMIADLVPEMKSVNAAHRQALGEDVSEVARSLTGRVAQRGRGPQEMRETATEGILNEIFPATRNQAEEIVGMGQDLSKYASYADSQGLGREAAQAREAMAAALRERMNISLNKAGADVGGFPNANIGGDFVRDVYATPAQKANIQAAVQQSVLAQGRTAADAQRAVKGFDNLMEALNTFNRVSLVEGVSPHEFHRAAGNSTLAKVSAPFASLRELGQRLARGSTAEEISAVLSSPQGIDQLEALARLGPEATYSAIFGSGATRAVGKMYTTPTE